MGQRFLFKSLLLAEFGGRSGSGRRTSREELAVTAVIGATCGGGHASQCHVDGQFPHRCETRDAHHP